METCPLISIVIPIYHPKSFFLDTLKSILFQKYQNFEVIISDDSISNPSVFEIDSRIKYFINDNSAKGIFSNLNNALGKISGSFVQIFCQDDIMKPNFLNNQLQHLLDNPNADMVFSQSNILFNQKEINGYIHQLPSLLPKKINLLYFFLLGCLPGNLSTVMLRKGVFQKIGFFDEKFKYAGDFEYWIRLGFQSDIIFNQNKEIILRQHKDQASFTLNHSILLHDLGKIYKILYKSLPENKQTIAYFYMNEMIGVQHLKRILSGSLTQWKSLKNLKYLNTSQFNLYLIVILSIFTCFGKIKLFTSKKSLNYILLK